MASEAQKRAAAAWRERHDLKRVELLVPGDTLARIDAVAGERNVSRAKLILEAVEQALGTAPREDGDSRLARIEGKLDVLLSRNGKAYPGIDTDHTEPKPDTQPDSALAQVVREMRGNGSPWSAVADTLNRRGEFSPRGKPWTDATIRTYCRRHGIE